MIRKWVAELTVLWTGQTGRADVTNGELDHSDFVQGHRLGAQGGEPGRRAFASPRGSARAVHNSVPGFEDEHEPPSSAFDVITLMELSLFLMLLTFFLVLTASTSFDDQRVGSVIGGIQSAFGVFSAGHLDHENARNGAALALMQTGARPATGFYASQVEAAFAAAGSEGAEVGGVSLNMVLRTDRLFVAGSAAIKADQRSLFAQIGPLLQIDEQQRHVAVLVPSNPDQRLDVRRAASIARLLLQEGANPAHIAVGVKETGEGLITFRFFTLPRVAP